MVRSTVGLQTFRRPPFAEGGSDHIEPNPARHDQDEDPFGRCKARLDRVVNAS
jgi:hypothetical protein